MRAFLALASLLAQLYAATPPHARPPSEELREQHGVERFVTLGSVLAKILAVSPFMLDIVALLVLSQHSPPTFAPFIRALLPVPIPDSAMTLGPTFLTGTCLTLAGAYMRAHCYRVLGSRFTFELAIRPTHTLVTDGLYGIVRHPSYTGIVALVLGWLLCLSDRRAWAVDACMLHMGLDDGRCHAIANTALVCVWVTMLVPVMYALAERMAKEDAMLEKNFGEAWRAWVKKVPCRLIPGVY